MSEQVDKKRGSLAGGVLGLAVGLGVLSVLLVLTSRSILVMLLIAPLVGVAAGMTLGERVAFFGRRPLVVFVVALVVLVVGGWAPIYGQGARLDRLRADAVSVYPDSELTGLDQRVIGRGKEVPGFAVRYRVDAPMEDVYQHLKAHLESEGWKEFFPVESGDTFMFRFRKAGYLIHIATDDIASEYVIMCTAYNLYYKHHPVPITPPEEGR